MWCYSYSIRGLRKYYGRTRNPQEGKEETKEEREEINKKCVLVDTFFISTMSFQKS